MLKPYNLADFPIFFPDSEAGKNLREEASEQLVGVGFYSKDPPVQK